MRSLADFSAPKESLVPDCIGMFAVTAGLGADELAKQFEKNLDGYNAIMAHRGRVRRRSRPAGGPGRLLDLDEGRSCIQ